MVHEKDLNLPCLKWIGLKLSDLNYFHLKNRENYLVELNKYDKKIAKNLILKFQNLQEYALIEEVRFKINSLSE